MYTSKYQYNKDNTQSYHFVRKYGYVPAAVLDTSSTGMQNREASRTIEVSMDSRIWPQ